MSRRGFSVVGIGQAFNGAGFGVRSLGQGTAIPQFPGGGGGSGSQNFVASQLGAKKPAPNVTLSYDTNFTSKAVKGETVGHVLKLTIDQHTTLSASGLPTGVTVKFFQAQPYSFIYPSFSGVEVPNNWYDPLIPLEYRTTPNQLLVSSPGTPEDIYIWVDIVVSTSASVANSAFTINAGSYSITCNIQVKQLPGGSNMPVSPAIPLWMDSTPYTIYLGQTGDNTQSNPAREVALGKAYIDALKSHRISPYKHFHSFPGVTGGLIDINASFAGVTAGSYKNTVFNNGFTGQYYYLPINTAFSQTWPASSGARATYLTAWAQTLAAQGISQSSCWTYLRDEPIDYVAQTGADIAFFKTHLPDVKVMVTYEYSATLSAGGIDIYCPIIDYWDTNAYSGKPVPSAYAGKEVWLYTSCVAQGCALRVESSPTEFGSDNGTPDLMVDRPSFHARSFFWTAKRYGVSQLLYYNSVDAYSDYSLAANPRIDPWNSIFRYGGNGDGTLFYPGRSGEYGLATDCPVPSIRLKLLREASYDMEYLTAQGASTAWVNAITSTLNRLDVYEGYQAVRDSIFDGAYAAPSANHIPGETYVSSVVAGNGAATVSWGAARGASTYNILWGTGATSFPNSVTGHTGTSYQVTGLTNAVTYYFKVQSVNNNGSRDCEFIKSATPVEASFAPTDISNLIAWIDPGSGVTKDGSNRISAITDRSGVGNSVSQGTSGAQPLWVDATLNSLPVISCDATSLATYKCLDKTSWVGGGTKNNMTFAIVVKPGGTGTQYCSLSSWDRFNDYNLYHNRNSKYCSLQGADNIPGTIRDGTTAASTAWKRIIFTWRNDGSNHQVRMWLDGVAEGAEASTSIGNPEHLRIGSGHSNAGGQSEFFYFNGMIAEVIAYDKILDATEIGNLDTYLKNKFAL